MTGYEISCFAQKSSDTFYLSSFIYCFFICYSLIIILRHYAFYNTNAAISDDRAIVLSF
ncbi:hypothetical protein HMPREF2532_03300 [Bacteroides ovatus]|nr:hypothetical protein HMPREF2532_03300 [Bacteroides ovatus]CAG9874796.1 hypothetical protein BOVAC2_1815 [Bacteroides ovatus]